MPRAPSGVPPIQGIRRGSVDATTAPSYQQSVRGPAPKRKATTGQLVKAAEDGDARAQFNAAVRLQREGHIERAVRYYQLSAGQYFTKAIYNLACLYEKGQGAHLRQDLDKAAELHMQAANLGDQNAQFSLAMLYKRGLGVPQNDRAALKYLRLAEAQGHVRASYNIGVMYEQGRGVMRNDEEAAAYYRRAAASGFTKAQVNLALMMAFGRGQEQDEEEAIRLLREAADLGDAGAAFNLSNLLERGIGAVQRDTATAVTMLERAARAEHPKAMYNLGMRHLRGENCQQSTEDALRLLGAAAATGDDKAVENFEILSSRKAPTAPSEAAKARVRAAVARRRRSLENVNPS